MYSAKPAASVVVSELIAENGLQKPQGMRRLDDAGLQAVDVTSNRVASLVDEILGKRWSRRQGDFIEAASGSRRNPSRTGGGHLLVRLGYTHPGGGD